MKPEEFHDFVEDVKANPVAALAGLLRHTVELRRELRSLYRRIEALEWRGPIITWEDLEETPPKRWRSATCPICRNPHRRGHRPDCGLALLLREEKPKYPESDPAHDHAHGDAGGPVAGHDPDPACGD